MAASDETETADAGLAEGATGTEVAPYDEDDFSEYWDAVKRPVWGQDFTVGQETEYWTAEDVYVTYIHRQLAVCQTLAIIGNQIRGRKAVRVLVGMMRQFEKGDAFPKCKDVFHPSPDVYEPAISQLIHDVTVECGGMSDEDIDHVSRAIDYAQRLELKREGSYAGQS